jgi:glycosyltransferase involved in cell wall biosynthesis
VAARQPQARFVVVGPAEGASEEAYRADVQAVAQAVGVADRLRFAGARRDMPAVMKALDLFVLTSRHEGFGRVVAEAMAAARPVVVTREGAPPELVEEDRFGLCARPADPGDFAEKIGRLMGQPAQAEAMAARAAERARGFDAAASAGRVLARYESLIGSRS